MIVNDKKLPFLLGTERDGITRDEATCAIQTNCISNYFHVRPQET